MEHGLVGLERHTAAGSHRLRGYAFVVGSVAAHEIGRDIGDRAVGLVVIGLADILPCAGGADRGERVVTGLERCSIYRRRCDGDAEGSAELHLDLTLSGKSTMVCFQGVECGRS